MVKVIATDLDGTLFKPRKIYSLVEKSNKKFLKNFYGDVVLVSGRAPNFCAKICNCLKIDHNFVALNGAIIVKNGKIIYKQSLKNTALLNLIDFMDENYSNYEIILFDKYDDITCYTNKNKFKWHLKTLKNKFKNGRLNEKIKLSNKKVKKLLNRNIFIYKAILYPNDGIEDIATILKEKFGEHFEFFPSNFSIEISPKGIHKGNSLKYLIDTTNISYDEVFVIGDGTNDIAMIETFPNSFAINTGSNKLKVKAKHIVNKVSDLEQYTKMNGNFK